MKHYVGRLLELFVMFTITFISLCCIGLMICFIPFIIMLVWNYFAPLLFGVNEITFLQSFTIVMFIYIICIVFSSKNKKYE